MLSSELAEDVKSKELNINMRTIHSIDILFIKFFIFVSPLILFWFSLYDL